MVCLQENCFTKIMLKFCPYCGRLQVYCAGGVSCLEFAIEKIRQYKKEEKPFHTEVSLSVTLASIKRTRKKVKTQ